LARAIAGSGYGGLTEADSAVVGRNSRVRGERESHCARVCSRCGPVETLREMVVAAQNSISCETLGCSEFVVMKCTTPTIPDRAGQSGSLVVAMRILPAMVGLATEGQRRRSRRPRKLLGEFGLGLSRLGNRGCAVFGSNSKVYIRLDKSQWRIDERSPAGWKATVRDQGLESLRTYLKEHAPKSYSFFRR
jgi:hypothetical protein